MRKIQQVIYFSALCSVLLLASCARPMARFTVSEGEKTAPTSVEFKNSSEKAESYEWDFGDGSKSSELSPVHEYRASGNYTIVLKAKKGNKVSTHEQKIQVKAPLECTVEIETDFGTMVAILYNATPQHRDNFIKLAEQGFYDGLLFHRVINGFMIQGGDPNSRDAKAGAQLGSGGPNYQIPAEFVDSLLHVKGALAAARTGDNINPQKKSSGSQFYIVQGRPFSDDQLAYIESSKGFHYTKEQKELYNTIGGTPHLDHDYTVFGRVIKGLDVIDKISAVQTLPGDRPKEDIKMKIRVIK